jgi:cytochrome oxidase Cu insertion factor (SCO1/SenC/PrrC family)
MPGMGRTVQGGNSLIVSSFYSALAHQLFVALAVLVLCALAFNIVRTVQYRHLQQAGSSFPSSARQAPEPLARRVLRIGFGCLWTFDGLLQLQSSMPLGLPSGTIQPGAATSPGWVQHLVNVGVTIWSDHPIQAAAAAVWIQIGLGVWLLVAPRGRWSRLGGVASLTWGLVVWVFGEAFGGIFAPGVTWLFGAPGAVLLYCVAGALIALPERAYSTPRLGRIVLGIGGVFLIGMAVLQVWPGRGYWQGRGGTLSSMVHQMAGTPQPQLFSSWVRAFAAFDDAHGWSVNLFVVLVLAAIGVLLLSGRRRLVGAGLIGLLVLCAADWVFVEDFGFFGGTGTDPNSMLPMALLFVGGYLAAYRLPAEAEQPAGETTPASAGTAVPGGAGVAAGVGAAPWWQRLSLSHLSRTVAAVAAVGIVLIGTAPMTMAAVNRTVDPVLTEALDGTPNAIDVPAPPFSLVDQRGDPVSLAGLRGHVIALTFLDPVCTTDCPLIAQEFRLADQQLLAENQKVDFVAIVANPIYRSLSFTNAFDQQEDLDHLSNWYYLTGTTAALQQVWSSYGELVAAAPNGAMVAHDDLAFVIDAKGHERDALINDPGPNQTYALSFTSLLHDRIDQVLSS